MWKTAWKNFHQWGQLIHCVFGQSLPSVFRTRGLFVSPLGKCHKVHFQFRRTIQICVISWPTLQVGFSKRGTVEFLEKVNRHYLRQKYFINRRHEWCCWHMSHYTTQDVTFSGLSDDNNKAPVYRTFPHLTVGNTLCRNLICTR